ncbi:MAG: hypothetical protein LBO79_02275 [Zoogloeaceae bacterium]|jgi:hypothetical protein|nr:hypothetical protein [Zoogloeaceae bacterium]
MRRRILPCLVLVCAALSGCEQIGNRLGLEDSAKKAARLGAEGKAVGGACRQSGRAIEDCYAIYAWLPMESIYAGWREMDEYMRENNLRTTTPMLPPVQDPGKRKKKKTGAETDTEQSGAEPLAAPAPEREDAVPAFPAAPSSGDAAPAELPVSLGIRSATSAATPAVTAPASPAKP